MPRRSRLLAPLLLAFVLAACANDERLPDEFDAGSIDNFPLRSVVTFADGVEVERATSSGQTGDQLFGGEVVFHLVRLESGDFIALSARDPHSGCWVYWTTDLPPVPQSIGSEPGWLRDPCHGSLFDHRGKTQFGPAPRDLDRYPVSIRDGRVYVTLTESARVPGETRVHRPGITIRTPA